MMKKHAVRFLSVLALAATAAVFTTGCQSPFPETRQIGANVDFLKGRKYRIIATNASGKSKGLRVLFFTNPPTYEEAIGDLYRSAGVVQTPEYNMINATAEFNRGADYFLASCPEIVIHADIIQFTDLKQRR